MNEIKTKGIVCKSKKIGEKDSLITILTMNHGVINAFAPGANVLKSKKHSSCQILCYSDFLINGKKAANQIKESSLIEMFYNIRNDVEKFALAQYFCEVACLLAPNDSGSGEYLKLLLNCIAFLCESKYPDFQIKSVFEMHILTISGYMPDLSLDSLPNDYTKREIYLDCINGQLVSDNNIINGSCESLTVSVLKALIYILKSDLKNAFAFSLSEKGFDQLNKVCERYLTTQLETNFTSLKIYKDIKRGKF